MSFRPLTAFSEAADGDLRDDRGARRRLGASLGISGDWAEVSQVHGADVVEVSAPGAHGPADGLFTTAVDLPLAVFTADCAGVVIEADDAVGIAHAGWRGTAGGVVASLRRRFDEGGHVVRRAVIGPHIRACCFEVGAEVAERFPGHRTTTTWGTTSVDLAGALREQLDGIDVVDFGACTHHEDGWFSHRRDGDPRRLVALVIGCSDG